MNIVIAGAPGSGKGTMTEILSVLGYNVISTGEMMRAEKKSGSELGKKISKLIDSGKLVPNDVVDEMVKNRVNNSKGKLLFDGYPRTLAQAKKLDTLVSPIKVIWLNVSDRVSIERNLKRGESSGRPDDMNVNIIKDRLDIFKKESTPIKKYYEETNRLFELDGEQSKEFVFSQILKIIKN